MTHLKPIILFSCALGWVCQAVPVQGEEGCTECCAVGCTEGCEERSPEPCIVCLDDLDSLFQGRPRRDPYEERIETERHDFTHSTTTVGAGVSQLEFGYTYFYRDDGEEIEETHALPEIMLRMGLSDDVEFRLLWLYGWQFFSEAPTESGSIDLIMSVKFRLLDQNGCVPASAVNVIWSAPTAKGDFAVNRADIGLEWANGYEFENGISITAGTFWQTSSFQEFALLPDEPNEDKHRIWAQSLALGFELTEVNSAYVEYYGLFSQNLVDNYSVSVANIGLDHFLSNNFVIDFRVGKGLSDDADDFFAGVGGAVRF